MLKKFSFLSSILFICLFISTQQSLAVVTIDTTSSGDQFTLTGVSSISWSHTVNSGLSRVLYVSVSTSASNLVPFPLERVDTVTYGGVALTRVGSQISTDNRNAAEVFRLINPTVGTATVQVNLVAGVMGATGVVDYAIGGSTSFFGVNQITPNTALETSSGDSDSPQIIVTGGVAGDIVLDVIATSPTAGAFGTGAGQTIQWRGLGGFSGAAFDVGASSTEPAMSPVTMSWVLSTSDSWALAGLAVRALAPTSASSVISGQIKTKSGRPISRTLVTLQNLETGEITHKISNHFGFYNFDDVETGNLYQITVKHGKYRFENESQIFEVTESLTNMDFIGISFGRNENPKKRRLR